MYSIGILLGIVSAAAYGLLDICSAYIARQIASLQALAVAHLLSAFFLLEWVLGSNMVDRSQYQMAWAVLPNMMLTGVVLGCLNAFANVCLYKAFATGKLAIISPLVSAYGIVPVFLSSIIGHEALTSFMLVSGALVLIGMVFVSSSSPAPLSAPPRIPLLHLHVPALADIQLFHPFPWLRSWRLALNGGVLWACGALLGFGLETYVMSRSTALFGPIIPLFFSRVTSTILLGALLLGVYWYRRRSRSPQMSQEATDQLSSPKAWRRGLVIAAMSGADLLGALSFSIGTQLAPTSIIALLSLSYPVFPLLFGLKVYRERLSARQWCGLVLLFPGVVGLALMDSDVLRQAGEIVRRNGGMVSIVACELVVVALIWLTIVKARQNRRSSGAARLPLGLMAGIPSVAFPTHETVIAISPVHIAAGVHGRMQRFGRPYGGTTLTGLCGLDEHCPPFVPDVSCGKGRQCEITQSDLEKDVYRIIADTLHLPPGAIGPETSLTLLSASSAAGKPSRWTMQLDDSTLGALAQELQAQFQCFVDGQVLVSAVCLSEVVLYLQHQMQQPHAVPSLG